MAKKNALGKGMASLLGAAAPITHVNESLKKMEKAEEKPSFSDTPYMVSIDQIKTNSNQPRKIFKEKELEELSNSIKENGIIQSLIVAKTENGFELLAGERRLRAAKRAGLKEVPVQIKRVTDKEKMVISIIENVQRSDLNCVEEALSYYQLMNDFNLTQEEVAKKIGKERSTIANFLRILKLPRGVMDLLQKEELSFGHAKVLASIKEREKAIRVAMEAAEKNLSVRELEKLIKAKKITTPKEVDHSFNEQLNSLKDRLEQSTGFHFGIKGNKNGNGQIHINYSNEAEFNDIFEYLLKR